MNEKNNIGSRFLLFLIISFLSISCLEDQAPSEINIELPSTSIILQQLEAEGDYINTQNVPTTLSASIVNSGQNFFKVIDLRPKSAYSSGHIPFSVNVRPDSIFDYIEKNVPDSILAVLVSESGQLSAYITGLFWMAGYNNIYSLNFGIASWNMDLAKNVFEEISELSSTFDVSLTNDEYEKAQFSPLPEINYNEGSSAEDFIIERCRSLTDDDFLVENYMRSNEDSYVICYGDLNLYKAHSTQGPMPGEGHPMGAVHYQHAQIYDLRSDKNLQTIPSDKKIMVYSYAGQLSAFVTAYLRLLGYDAYSLKYGASQFIYDRLVWSDYTYLYVFKESDIMNYDYEKQ